jgi:hypothetical protein
MEWTMLRLVNKDRRDHRLPPLFMQSDLSDVARKHSKDMARLDYFDHTNFVGQSHADRYTEARISDVVSGENLAKIGGYKHPVHRAEQGLMNSPGHRANILNKSYNCVGIGVYKSEKKVYFYTQNFAKRQLVFLKKIPHTIRRKKGLVLYIQPVRRTKVGVYRIKEDDLVIREQGFLIKRGKNRLHIPFTQKGKYTVELFVGSHSKKQLHMANSFELRVNEGWFG